MSTNRNNNDHQTPGVSPALASDISPDSVASRVFRVNLACELLSIQSESPGAQECVSDQDVGRPVESLLPESVAKQFRESVMRAENLGEPQLIRYQQQLDDTVCFFEARISKVFNDGYQFEAQSRVESNDATPADINKNPVFEVLVARLPGALYRADYDSKWTILDITSGIEEFLGYTVDELTPPDGLTFLDLMYEPDRASVQRLVEKAIQQNSLFTLEYRMVHADGRLRWVNEQGQAIRDENNVPICLEGIIMDITESVRQRSKAALPSAQLASIGTLGAGVAHEINNAIAIMMANLDYAVEELEVVNDIVADDARMRGPMEDINASLATLGQGMKRIQKIVHDLRSYSDAAGSQTLETIDLVRLLEWALQESTDLTTSTTIIRNFPDHPVLLCGNQLGLLQVFSHLLSNAEKSFTTENDPENKITISVKAIQNEAALIEVSDTGRGITSDILPRIFEPFFSTRPIGEGTGLGLFVCQGVVHSMDGEILISSTPGKGTSVQIILPTNFTCD